MKLGTVDMQDCKLGSTSITEVRRGTEKIWPNNAGYQLVAKTTSNYSAWCFDRFRLYTADANTMVEIRKPDGTVIDSQPFHTGGGWTTDTFEHDFTFDLSSNTTNEELEMFIKGIPIGAKFQQLYAHQTGFGSTRYELDPGIDNAQLTYWNLNLVNFTQDTNDRNNVFRVENNGITLIDGLDVIGAGIIHLQNNFLTSGMIDSVINGADASERTGGTLDYSNNSGNPTSASRASFDNLINNKNWIIIGTAPPI